MKTAISLVLTLVSTSAMAQSQCIQNFQTSLGSCDSVAYAQIMKKHGQINECKTVQWSGVNEQGNSQSVDQQVVLLDKNGIAVINNKITSGCKVRYMALTDTPREAKALNGRVIIRSATGRIYAVTRTGSVKELLNNTGGRYFGVKDIKIDSQRDVVEITHNSKETLTPRELFDRVNRADQSEIVGM